MPEGEEALLHWRLDRWQGAGKQSTGKHCFVWLSGETMQRYIISWLAYYRRIEAPTPENRAEALDALRKISYWENANDPAVHVIQSARRC